MTVRPPCALDLVIRDQGGRRNMRHTTLLYRIPKRDRPLALSAGKYHHPTQYAKCVHAETAYYSTYCGPLPTTVDFLTEPRIGCLPKPVIHHCSSSSLSSSSSPFRTRTFSRSIRQILTFCTSWDDVGTRQCNTWA